MALKIIFGILTIVGFAAGFLLLINGESLASCLLILIVMIVLLSGAIGDLKTRMKRVECYLENQNKVSEERGED